MRTSVIAGSALLLVLACSGSDGSGVPATPDAGLPRPADPPAPCVGCGDAAAPKTRPFRMGFTPFPWDLSADAQAGAYESLARDADLYAYHHTAGVPWKATAAGKGFAEWGSSIRGTFIRQRTEVKPGHAVYLGLTPLDDGRTRLADEWGDGEHMPLEAPWTTYAFDDPVVKAAYLAFCEAAIAEYTPDYLAIGIEVNLLEKAKPDLWPAYLALHRATYAALKASHPTLPVFVSVTAVDMLANWTDVDTNAQLAALGDVLPYSDYLALSFYPYMSRYLTGAIPGDTFERLGALANGKPIVIAESGYPAETFTLASIPATFEGTPEKQDGWIEKLLEEADTRRFPFVVNFVARDYDALWAKLPPQSRELGLVWRDTGFLTGDGTDRTAMARWRAMLARPYQRP